MFKIPIISQQVEFILLRIVHILRQQVVDYFTPPPTPSATVRIKRPTPKLRPHFKMTFQVYRY